MDGADLTHTRTGANQYLPEDCLTFTFKTALKEQGEWGEKERMKPGKSER